MLLSSLSEVTTPASPIESEISYPNTTADDIEARLVLIKGIFIASLFFPFVF